MVREATQWEREEMEKVVRDYLCSRICLWWWLCQACESQGRCHRLSLLQCTAMGSSEALPHCQCHGMELWAFPLCGALLCCPGCSLALLYFPVHLSGDVPVVFTKTTLATCWYLLAKLQLQEKWPMNLEVPNLITFLCPAPCD